VACFLAMCSLLPITHSASLDGSVTLTTSNKVIRTAARYIIDLRVVTSIPAGGKITMEFPSQYTRLTDGSLTCSFTKCSACTCTVASRVITVTGWTTSTDTLLSLEFPTFINPTYAGKFTYNIITYDASSRILDWTYSLTETFAADSLYAAQLVPGSDVTGQLSTWTIRLVMKYGLSSGGSIIVTFPRWNEDPTRTTSYGAYCSVQNTITCTPVDGFVNKSFINCGCVAGSDNTSRLVASINEDLAANTLVLFTATNIRNPLTTMAFTAFSITTQVSAGSIEVSDGITMSVQVSTPSNLSVRINSITQTGVNVQTAYSLRFTCPLPTPTESSLFLSFPTNEVIINSSFTTSFVGSLGIIRDIRNPAFSNNDVFLSKVFTYRDANSDTFLSITNVQNPPSTKVSNPIHATISFEVGGVSYSICKSQSGATVTATSGGMSSIGIDIVDTTVNLKTAYTFSFTPSNDIPIGGSILITAPSGISFSNRSKGNCFQVTGLHKDVQCEVTDGTTLKITGGIRDTAFIKGSTIIIQQDGITNPRTTSTTSSGFIISTFIDESSTNIIDTGTSDGITATAGTLSSVRVYLTDSSKKITGEITEYTFEIIPANTIPKGGKVIIEFPEEVLIADTSLACVNKKGFESTITCNQQFNKVEVTRGFELADFAPQELSFAVQKVRNPQSTQASSSFKVYTMLGDAYIDQKLDSITVTMELPHDVKDGRIVTSSSIVGSSSDFTFYFIPYNPFPSGGTVLLEPPSDLSFPANPICTQGSAFLSSISCTLESTRLVVTLTLPTDYTTNEIYFTVAGMTNPASTKETSSFRLTTKRDTYLIDSRTSGLTVKVTTAASMTDVTITADKLGISELASYTFTMLTLHTVPQNGYVNVKLPGEITITSYLQCTKDSTFVSCTSLGNNNVKLDLFPTSFNPAQISFSISGLRNYHLTIQSSAFVITTRTDTGFDIDSNSSRVVVFTCYSPCETCTVSPSNCLTCISSSDKPYFWDSKCNSVCQSSYSDLDNDRKTCEACSSGCRTCSGTSESNFCTACITNSNNPYLKDKSCISDCGTHYTANTSFECIECDATCKTCDRVSTRCTSCDTTKPDLDKLYKNSCIATCDPDTMVEISGTCFDCNELCNRCSGDPNFCIACKSNLYLHNGTCLSSCPMSVTLTIGQQCVDCASPCRTCLGEVSYCTSCVAGYSLYENKCLTKCPLEYTSINGICEKCSSECMSCLGSTNFCSECAIDKLRYNGRCVNECPENVTVKSVKECLSCASPCATCETNTSRCTSCVDGYSLNGNVCVTECPQNTVSLGGYCTPCNIECATCEGSPSNCKECAADRVSYNGSCLLSCPNQSTVQVGFTCAKCNEPCVTCENTVDTCLTCIEGRILYEGQCLENCPSGYEAYQGECIVPGLSSFECAKGCIFAKRQNSVCDQECNVAACSFDNGACLPTYGSDEMPSVLEQEDTEYDNTPVIEEEPMGCTIVGVAGVGASAISKVVTGSSAALGSLALSSVIEAVSWIAVVSMVGEAEDTHGRELLETNDDEILVVFVLLLIVLIVHYVLNVVFVFLYYFQVIKEDNMHRNWIRRNRVTSTFSVLMMIFVSFKFVRILYSKLFGLKCFNAIFEHKTRLFRPLLILTYISLSLTSIPFIALFVYILSVFSTGNIVWLIALDSLIMTSLVTFISIYDIIQISHTLAREAHRGKLKSLAANPPTPFGEALDFENIKIFPPTKDDNYLDSTTNMGFFRTYGAELETTRFANLIDKQTYNGKLGIQEPDGEMTQKPDDNTPSHQNSNKRNEEDRFMEEEDFYADSYDPRNIHNSDLQEEFSREAPRQDVTFSVGDHDGYFNLETADKGDESMPGVGASAGMLLLPFVKEKEEEEEENSYIEAGTEHLDTEAAGNEDVLSENIIKEVDHEEVLNQENPNQHPIDNEQQSGSDPNNHSHADSIPEPIPEKDPSLAILSPILVPLPPPLQQDSDSDQSHSWGYEDSREYFDEENEPQLLETIPEESVLELSEAEIDKYDPECIIVPHIPSNLDILIKKSFSGALIVDDSGQAIPESSPIKSNQYQVVEVDPTDVHYAKLKRSNSETLIRVKRDFRGAHILDVKLRVGDRWMVGRTVTNEDDFEFEKALVDLDDPEAVIVTHNLTGYKMKVKKPFFGSPRVDPTTGRVILTDKLVRNYDIGSVQVDRKDVHYASLREDGVLVRVKRNFLGGRILDIISESRGGSRAKTANYFGHNYSGPGFELYKIPENLTSAHESAETFKPSKPQMSLSTYKFTRTYLEDPPRSNYNSKNVSPKKRRKRRTRTKKLSAYDSVSGSLSSSPERSSKKGSIHSSPGRKLKLNSLSPSPHKARKPGSSSSSPRRIKRKDSASNSPERITRKRSVGSSSERASKKRGEIVEPLFVRNPHALKSLEEIYLQRLELPGRSSPSLSRKSSKKLKDLPSQKTIINPFTNPHGLNESTTSYNKDSVANLLNMRGMAGEMDLELLRKSVSPYKKPKM
jgi:hypothetical protein